MFYRFLPSPVSDILDRGKTRTTGPSQSGGSPLPDNARLRYAERSRYESGSRLCVRESAPAYEGSVESGDEPEPTCDDAAASCDRELPAFDEGEAGLERFSVKLQYADAATVHKALQSLFRVGRRVLLCSIDALRVMRDNVHYLEIGYSSFANYCERELGLGRSTAYEYVRAAEALDELPRLRALFGRGEVSWDQVRAITRIATPQTEVEWIELAFDEPVGVLQEEVRAARREGRDVPHDRRYGLPNLMVKMTFKCTIEERERVLNAFAVVSHGFGVDLGCDGETGSRSDGDRRAPLVRWADAVLSGEIPGSPAEPGDGEQDDGEGKGTIGARPRTKRGAPAQTILYRTCPECGKSTVDTAEGRVAVSPERVAELEAVSNHVEITPEEEERVADLPAGEVDKPNSARLTRQVLHRDGLKCANPDCNRTDDLQAHHIKFRSEGGPTSLSNEVAVCRICHAMIHEGLLEVTGSVDSGLTWKPHPVDPTVKVYNAEALHQLLKALVAKVPTPAAPEGEDGKDGFPRPRSRMTMQSRYVDSHRLEALIEALTDFGFRKSDSEERVRWAVATLIREKSADPDGPAEPEPLDDQEIINKAFQFGQPGF